MVNCYDGDDVKSGNLCCCRVGIGNEGVGGVLTILFKVKAIGLKNLQHR